MKKEQGERGREMNKEKENRHPERLGSKELAKTKANLVKMNERAINRLKRMREIRETLEATG